MSTTIKSGQYVVPKSQNNWVYDVTVVDGDVLVAVVGFCAGNKDGALFWQGHSDSFWRMYEDRKADIIKAAKKYAISQGVPLY
jgi:hypothetical protein